VINSSGQDGPNPLLEKAVTKLHAIKALTKSLSEPGYRITVNAVIPSLIDTPLTRHEERYAQVLQDAGKRPAGSSTDEEEARKILTTKTPLGVPWIGTADVAPVVVFLASDAAGMVSGATYDVTAGDSARHTA
jgi:NAD(P)-dependent dehydrogenase (short-subunit alcohol dehydrogenase family)